MVAAKVTNRLVVAHMTKNEMQYLDSSLIGPAMLFLNQYFNFFINEYYVLWLCFIWVTLDLFRYSAQVCLEICDHMKIKLFRISVSDHRVHASQAPNIAEKNGTNRSQRNRLHKKHSRVN
ncbi:PREDICTED: choline/ethanolaminephosphotransferase 1-like [Dinoponera quadriceps]|uniref:Choline/ethanolaminephosphotransferase 1-like n=1 Tax=Dinoponera quadriceps TaxID=609295 RepID=A0A6P3YDL7_DINQU|nr:PREDICTED: choline/ethanolaminephosphotransferase 1-like [Dinoponera quadriceps]